MKASLIFDLFSAFILGSGQYKVRGSDKPRLFAAALVPILVWHPEQHLVHCLYQHWDATIKNQSFLACTSSIFIHTPHIFSRWQIFKALFSWSTSVMSERCDGAWSYHFLVCDGCLYLEIIFMSKRVMNGPLLTPPHSDQCYQWRATFSINQSDLRECDISVIFGIVSKSKDGCGDSSVAFNDYQLFSFCWRLRIYKICSSR